MPPDPRARRQRAARLAFWLTAAFLLGAATGPFWLAAASVGVAWKPLVGRLEWFMLMPVALLLPIRAPLENANRQRILAYLGDQPGASIQEVREHLDVAWGTTVYHLDRLRRDGLLVSHRHGNHHRYWLSNTPEARLRRGWCVLEQPTARDIALAVASTPGLHQSAICDALDVRAPNASKHLSRLERHGLVAKRRISRFAVYEPTDALHELLHMQAAAVGGRQSSAQSRQAGTVLAGPAATPTGSSQDHPDRTGAPSDATGDPTRGRAPSDPTDDLGSEATRR